MQERWNSTWCDIPKLISIIQLLAYEGQIKYKVLGGKQAAQVASMRRPADRKKQKSERQQFIKSLKEFQYSLLKQLGYQEVKLSNFLLGNNQNLQLNNPDYSKIEHLIDPNFFPTFQLIIEYATKNSIEIYEQINAIFTAILIQPETHKHITHWATICYYTYGGRALLYEIQTNQNAYSQQFLDEQVIECKLQQNQILSHHLSLAHLLKDEQFKNSIKQLIKDLLELMIVPT